MNDYTPYDHQLRKGLEQIPIPDENRAWEDMRHRLDRDKKRRRIIPPFLSGCAGILLLLLVGGGITWFVLKQTTVTESEITIDNQVLPPVDTKIDSSQLAFPIEKMQNTSVKKQENELITEDENKLWDEDEINTKIETAKYISRKNRMVRQNNKNRIRTKTEISKVTTRSDKSEAGKEFDNIPTSGNNSEMPTEKDTVTAQITDKPDNVTVVTETQKHESDVSTTDEQPVKDTVTVDVDSSSVQSAKQPSYFFGAGISLFQQIPVNGQKSVPYNAYGRRGSIADYIPAVDLRFYRNEKWFVHAGFRYGAPQYTREFIYSSHSVSDSSSGPNITTTTSLKLRKTYYHQLPLSFNYYVVPGWSVGAGAMWSRFHGAIVEREVRLQDGALLDTVIGKHTLNIRNTDSFFTKSHISALFETQYHWRRFTLGVRYTQGLQPYIKGGAIEEKNSAWNLFLRFEFWRGKRY